MVKTFGFIVPVICLLAVGVLKQAGLVDGDIADVTVSFLIGGGAGIAVGGAFVNTPKDD